MRSKWWDTLLVILLLAGCIPLAFSRAAGPAPKKPRPAVSRTADPEENIVDGIGKTAADARVQALKHVQDRVEKLLIERCGSSGWTPPPELLSIELLTRHGVVQALGEPKPDPRLNDMKAIVARYRVELTKEYLREVQSVVREQRVQDRHLILARVLGGLVVLLLVVTGYLRLEDMTRGYATALLRVAAIGLVALASGALWLTV
jgi:hypothetical protein